MKHSLHIGLCSLLLFGCASQPKADAYSIERDTLAISNLFEQWLDASEAGDLEGMRSLIADDALFILAYAGRMGKDNFATAATGTDPYNDYELDCSIEEIQILGDYAWMASNQALHITNKATQATSTMAGHSLSILKRQGNGWVVIRDANTVVPLPPE